MKMTPQKWLDKASWQGSLEEGFFYGLDETDLDESDPEFNNYVKITSDAYKTFAAHNSNLYDFAKEKYEI